MLSTAEAATLYFNDFDSTGLTNATAEFTVDAGNGVLDYAAGGGTVVSTASESISGIGTLDFTVSTRFALNTADGSGTQVTMGFGAFGSSSDFLSTDGNSFYLADWGVTEHDNWGKLRILALGDNSGFSAVDGDSDGAGENGSSVVVGNTYELRLTGTHTGGALNMTLALFDDVGAQLGTVATATDLSPLTGEFFGYRNRTAGANHAVDVSYDNFSVSVVAEPSSIALAIAGVVGLVCVGRKSLRRLG